MGVGHFKVVLGSSAVSPAVGRFQEAEDDVQTIIYFRFSLGKLQIFGKIFIYYEAGLCFYNVHTDSLSVYWLLLKKNQCLCRLTTDADMPFVRHCQVKKRFS